MLSEYQAFNHEQSQDVEAEYDRMRDAAREQAAKRSSCFERVCLSYQFAEPEHHIG